MIHASLYDKLVKWADTELAWIRTHVESLPLGPERKRMSHRWCVRASRAIDKMNKTITLAKQAYPSRKQLEPQHLATCHAEQGPARIKAATQRTGQPR